MGTQQPKGLRAIAVFLAFATAQIIFQLSFAAPASSSTAIALPQQFIARLSTSGGSITVDGLSASNGASLVTGARIETQAAVSATIDLGSLGSLNLLPNSDVKLDFDENGKTVEVTAFKGCFALKTTKGTLGQVYTEQQEKVAESNRAAAGEISGCVGSAGFTQASGAAAGAGAGAVAGGGGALGAGATAATVIASLAVPATLYFTHRPDSNPSPSAP